MSDRARGRRRRALQRPAKTPRMLPGWTSLHRAAHDWNAREVALLLEGGASVDARTGYGHNTPLQQLLESTTCTWQQLLLAADVNLSARDVPVRDLFRVPPVVLNWREVFDTAALLLRHGSGTVSAGWRADTHPVVVAVAERQLPAVARWLRVRNFLAAVVVAGVRPARRRAASDDHAGIAAVFLDARSCQRRNRADGSHAWRLSSPVMGAVARFLCQCSV